MNFTETNVKIFDPKQNTKKDGTLSPFGSARMEFKDGSKISIETFYDQLVKHVGSWDEVTFCIVSNEYQGKLYNKVEFISAHGPQGEQYSQPAPAEMPEDDLPF